MLAIRRVYDWMETKAGTPAAVWWLVFLFFIESSCFPIPVDPLLMLFCLADRRRSWYFASLATAASVVGGLAGYMIGSVLWQSVGQTLVHWCISEAAFASAVHTYEQYEHWAVLIAGFTPIPYKAITVSAGFCHLPLAPFIIYSTIARGARFFLVTGILWYWGPPIKAFIDRYFDRLVMLFTVVMLGGIYLIMR